MEINILGICGSPIKGGNTEAFLKEALKAAESGGSVKTELIPLAGKDVRDCRHCNWCVTKQEEGKFCAQNDDMAEIFPRILKADALLLATPVYIGRLSGYLACFTDRLRVFTHGKVYRGKLRNKVGGALAVGWQRGGGTETATFSIVLAFLTLEMIPVAPDFGLGSPFGATGLSSQGGTGKFDRTDKLGVFKDEFGIRGAHSLGKRVVEVTKLLKAGGK